MKAIFNLAFVSILLSVCLNLSHAVCPKPSASGGSTVNDIQISNFASFSVSSSSPEGEALLNNDSNNAIVSGIESDAIAAANGLFSNVSGFDGVSSVSLTINSSGRKKRDFASDVQVIVNLVLRFTTLNSVDLTGDIERQLILGSSSIIVIGSIVLNVNSQANVVILESLELSFVIRMFYFSRSNANNLIQVTGGNVSTTSFSKTKKVWFATHGFTDNGLSTWLLNIKNNLLSVEDMNVILVDWSDGAKGPNYALAATNTKAVGKAIADFLTASGVDRINLAHCVGHSLGSHVCGFAGKNGKLKRICGLDPAGPSFINFAPADRLNSTDAVQVDIIHSDAGYLGIDASIGHKDFWPNGGNFQAGCNTFQIALTTSDLSNLVIESVACSHGRAPLYFSESILSLSKFKASKCDSWTFWNLGLCPCFDLFGVTCPVMGYYAWTVGDERGNYYLRTNAVSPFSQSS